MFPHLVKSNKTVASKHFTTSPLCADLHEKSCALAHLPLPQLAAGSPYWNKPNKTEKMCYPYLKTKNLRMKTEPLPESKHLQETLGNRALGSSVAVWPSWTKKVPESTEPQRNSRVTDRRWSSKTLQGIPKPGCPTCSALCLEVFICSLLWMTTLKTNLNLLWYVFMNRVSHREPVWTTEKMGSQTKAKESIWATVRCWRCHHYPEAN